MAKILKVGTKSQAYAAQVNSLFKPVNGRTLNAMKWDNGKYRADRSFIGREIEVSDDVVALYTVKRQDSDGAYVQLMCITAS